MPRRIAISDIHGCFRTFEALLDRISFGTSDTLYLLGDFVDRGPRSAQTIDYIIGLQSEGYRIHALRGNHDQYLLDAILVGDKASRNAWKSAGAASTKKSYASPDNPSGDIDPVHVFWLNDLPYYYLLDDYVLVHAGLNFRRRNPLKGKRAMLNLRNWYRHIDYDWLGDRRIVHGHTPLPRTQVEAQAHPRRRAYPVFDIDAGCFHQRPGMGHLCALNLDERTFTFVANLDR
jgi:serine/threonine protein phosphatase 1